MKIAFSSLCLLALGTSLSVAFPAHAAPSGPSARAAARLKKRPTSNWLAHYLPDDRYKIAGGVWRYVSTDLDTYYHRPDSALMLRQSPARVIGFASAAEAEEAGYRSDGNTNETASFGAMAGATRTSARATRITLADGVSSLVLPGGWQRGPSVKQSSNGTPITADVVRGPNGQQLGFITVMAPANVPLDLSRVFNVRAFTASRRQVGEAVNRAGAQPQSAVNSQLLAQFQQAQSNQKVFQARLSGIEGVGIANGAPAAGQPKRVYFFARGRKVWAIVDSSQGSSNFGSLYKTVRFR